MKRSQIIALVLIGILYFLSLVVAWLGVSPEASFFEFYRQAQTFLAVSVVIAPLLTILAFILGWKPEIAFLQWFRDKVILPVFTSQESLTELISILCLILVVQAVFLVSLWRRPAEDVIQLMFAGDFTGAFFSLDEVEDANEKNEIKLVLEAVDQSNMKLSQSHDAGRCRDIYAELSDKTMLFRPFWTRYLFNYAKASCLYVLDDIKAAAGEYRNAMLAAKRINKEESQRCNRKIGRMYFFDFNNQLGIPDPVERIKHAQSYFVHDSSITGQRELGDCYYLTGQYADALIVWDRLLSGNELSKNCVEKKRTLNAIALSLAAQYQYEAALEKLATGLNIDFDRRKEDQRREQIRLLGTKAFVYAATREGELAWKVWQDRLSIMEQKNAPCLYLLESQILATRYRYSAMNPRQKKDVKRDLINDLLKGTGQKVEAFVDRNRESLQSLLNQAEMKFEKCYLGLKYQAEGVKYVLDH